jgi:pimeloyl-ACP methyl ester carboxylesterase
MTLEHLLAADWSDELTAIVAPTLIVRGDDDPLVPASEQPALLKAIKSARLVAYPGTGHNLHWEEPERFVADFVSFVEAFGG